MIKKTKVSDDVEYLQHYCDKCGIETIYYSTLENQERQYHEHICPSCKKRYYEDRTYPYIERINNKEE